jgi:hypothetical protein
MPMYPSCPRCESSRVRPVLVIESSALHEHRGSLRLRCRACDHRWDSTTQPEGESATAGTAPLRMVGVKSSGEVAGLSYSRPEWDWSVSSR